MHNDDKDVASDADRTRTSDPWDTRAPPTKGQEVPPADMDFARRGLNKKTTRCLTRTSEVRVRHLSRVPNPDLAKRGREKVRERCLTRT
jgi:hypothetical protein